MVDLNLQPNDTVSNYRIISLIIQTKNSYVYKAEKLNNEDQVCLKFIPPSSYKEDFSENEYSLMQEINCDYIVKAIDFFQYQQYKVIVMPLLSGICTKKLF